MLYALILAGGKGERFWPLSRSLEPKQFLKVTGEISLIQQTISRIKKLIPLKHVYIITNYQHQYEIKRQIATFDFPLSNIILEPEGKNTAVAIGLAAKQLYLIDKQAIMVVLPSDHFIKKEARFSKILKTAEDLAKKDYLVCLGIKPTRPKTGYGYIETAARLPGKSALKVVRFIEKPVFALAKKFFKDKRFFWNSGIFLWKARVILEELERYAPLIYKKFKRLRGIIIETYKLKEIYRDLPSISIDYAVMEKSKKVILVPATDLGWNDVGSWDHRSGSTSSLTSSRQRSLSGDPLRGRSGRRATGYGLR